MTWNKRVPFNPRTGDLLDYVDSYTERSISIEWKNNFEFDAELEYLGHMCCRSSVQMVLFTAHTGTKSLGVNMFLTDFDDLIRTIGFNGEGGQSAVGRFTFRKRDRSFGCVIVKEQPQKVRIDKSSQNLTVDISRFNGLG